MRFELNGMSLWYGTSDAPAPEGPVTAGSPVALTAGVQPPSASNSVLVHYRVNGGPTQTVTARWLRHDSLNKAQYFTASLPVFQPGDTVEYLVACICAGRQLPSADKVNQFPSSFHVIAVEEKRVSGLASRANLFLPTATPMETQAEAGSAPIFTGAPSAPVQPMPERPRPAPVPVNKDGSAADVIILTGPPPKDAQDDKGSSASIPAPPSSSGRPLEPKRNVQIEGLINNAPLINAVAALPNIKQPSDLVRLTEEDWKSLIRRDGVGVPDETPGADAEEKTRNYAQQILARVEKEFPTPFFAEQLGESNVAKFLKSQPYDLKIYPARFFKANPGAAGSLSPADRGLLENYQRLYRVTEKATDAIALSKSGFKSATQIARIDPGVLAKRMEGILPAERAREIHSRAQRAAAASLALWSKYGGAGNRTAMHALPPVDRKKLADAAKNTIPDWETLFGGFDFCACEECASAHGPAAYFVDMLHFLSERAQSEIEPSKSVKGALFERRPDLGDIELSCENTNTVLPLIDLTNEVLENAVAPPPAFTPFVLAATLEADLAQTVATAMLAGAFHPPLQSGSRVETLEAGKRWRIWDEAFAYSVIKENNELKVSARSRQTTGSTNERQAMPQYRNSAAYAELSRAVYPWNLPFDLPAQEANVFLTHLGVSRRDLIEALRPEPDPFDANSPVVVGLAAERLGLTDTERRIIVGEPLDPPRHQSDFWGSTSVAELSTVQAALDRSGLSYAELDSLISTWFINPDKAVTISAIGPAVDTCDTNQLQITGLTAGVLERMHRFVRLWRRLGWTIREVDRAIRALSPDHTAPVLTDEILVRLDHLRTLSSQLRLSVAQTLALWRPIDTEEPGSLYRNLFYNPAVFKPQDEDFRLRPDGEDLVFVDKFLTDHSGVLQAAFRLNSASLALLLASTDGKLTLGNLSFIYRHATMARQLGLSVQDLLTAIELTGIDPFKADRSQDTLRFVEVVNAIRTSGFDFAELDYLLRHRFNPAAPFTPTESSLQQTIEDIRAGLLKVNAQPEADVAKLQKSSVIDRVSAALALPADMTDALVERVSHEGKTALERFVDLATIASQQPLSRDNAKPQFEALEKLLKIANIIQTLNLSSGQLDWLFRENGWLAAAPDIPGAQVPFGSWFSLIELPQLRRDLNLEDAALEAILSAVSAVAVAADQSSRLSAKKGFVDALSIWLGWAQADLETLVGKSNNLDDLGLLNARVPDSYRINLVTRLNRAISMLKRLGVSAAQANDWRHAAVTDANAKAIRSAAKSKHNDDDWQKLVIPLQNSLRDKQREALVSYLVARPAKWAKNLTKAGANDLYSRFLIDVEMSSCQLTSRIKQAIGSVQLFAQRCLMGLEPDIKTSDEKWVQWNWMKTFRVWEANRKIWLYPENWIEPELRDDKTPFFKELENELLQTDLDDASAEQAFMRYLEKLDAVARLEIVGVYEDDEDKTLHVFGRTWHTPRLYYYRRRSGKTQTWTPWEKVELDIEGDHLIPVMWNRKLMLIWAIFNEKAEEQDIIMPEPKGTMTRPPRYWEIQLAWSEYQNGRWSGKNLTEPVKFDAHMGDNNITFDNVVISPFARKINEIGDNIESIPIQLGKVQARTGVALRPIGNGNGSPDDDKGRNQGDMGGSGDVGSGSTPTTESTDAKPPLVPKELISFKALASSESEMLIVRGYLRRDYHQGADSGDLQIACPFGEFRFFGCRKIVTTSAFSMVQLNFPLAPTVTKFDRMWFTETGPGLVLFDGKLPVSSGRNTTGLLGNVAVSIAGDRCPTLANKLDIPVLDQTPTTFRLLAPHQDLQFVGDRPFFFMDGKRTFMVTSKGSSEKSSQQNPACSPRTLPSAFSTTRQYRFANFHHPFVCEFVKALNRRGVSALLSLDEQTRKNDQSFDAYKPEARVLKEYPVDEVEFQSGGAYEVYNWELFFHIPLMIANQLGKNQRFQEAQRWFHFIFDPTNVSGGEAPQRYWRTKPFNDRQADDYEAQEIKSIEDMIAQGASPELNALVERWRDNPFNPHSIARLRTSAYQKNVVMKYIDNLIAWGDQLFRRETLESINEATQLYVLASEILGRRPEVIERNLKAPVETFNSLEPKLGALGNALEQIELLVGAPGDEGLVADSSQTPDLPSNTILYFCVPENYNLLEYWNTVGDRLFKIRHCMNIEGQVRQLPLFEPPLDPALLVRAQAAGLSIGDVLSDISTSVPNYRFPVMLQKANEVVAEVRNLGAGLLSALEKRDAEALSTLRSGQELRLLEAVREVRAKQVEEAKANISALEKSHEMAQSRKDYYESREFMNLFEAASLTISAATIVPMVMSASAKRLASIQEAIGTFKLGSPTTMGAEVGPHYLARALELQASVLDEAGNVMSLTSQLTGRMGDYTRRQDEWDHQANLATIELKQVDQQLAAAHIRLTVAERELRNHDQQTDNAREVDQFMRGKFTNQDLFQWMIGQVSGLYFQSYQLAYDLAKRAELCMQRELGLKYGETSFIRFGYWDSLKKGLLAGDHLAYDLKRLEIAHLDRNVREYELTKHVSLISLAPEQLIALKETGGCEFEIPEWLFDLDTPGHYSRRIKMVSVTIPCVTGPYTSIHCKLQLLKSSFRRNPDLALGYDRVPTDDTNRSDDRFIDDRSVLEAIVTSTAQNDAGLFEPNMRDERYLPFEGAGAMSRWRLELPTKFRAFDYNSISDVILHLRYTARDGGAQLSNAATTAVTNLLGAGDAQPLFRLFSLRHEFPSEWYRFVSSPASAVNTMKVEVVSTRFPYFVQTRKITVKQARVFVRTKSPAPIRAAISPGEVTPDLTQIAWTGHGAPGLWTVGTGADPKLVEDIFVILAYSAS